MRTGARAEGFDNRHGISSNEIIIWNSFPVNGKTNLGEIRNGHRRTSETRRNRGASSRIPALPRRTRRRSHHYCVVARFVFAAEHGSSPAALVDRARFRGTRAAFPELSHRERALSPWMFDFQQRRTSRAR